MTSSEPQQLLQAGIDAVKRGQKERARELLLQVVEADEHNEYAWLWLSAVVDTLADKITALENALHINPNSQAAQRGLAALRSQQAAQPAHEPEEAQAAEEDGGGLAFEDHLGGDAEEDSLASLRVAGASSPDDAAGPAGDISDYAPISPVESMSAIDDPHQCVYCGAMAAGELKRCPECRRSLMVRTGQQYASPTLRTAVFALIVQFALSAVEAIVVAVLFYQGDNFLVKYVFESLALDAIFGNYVAWPDVWAVAIMWIGFGWAAALAAATLTLYYRVGLAYYGAIGALGVNILWAIFRWLNGFSGLVLGVANTLVSIIALSFVFAAERDFEVNDARLVCAVDTRIKGAEALHKLGHEYKNRGQWALAVQYWRAAVGAMPTVANYYRDLAIGCAQIGYYERSLKALDEFARLAPDNADAVPMRELIQRKRAADPRPRG